MHNIPMQNVKAGCSFDIGNTDSMAICVLLQAWIAQPPAAMDLCEAILHLQYDFVIKVVADFVLSNQSDDKFQAQQFTRTLSWSQINYLCTGQDDLVLSTDDTTSDDDTVLTSSNPTGSLAAAILSLGLSLVQTLGDIRSGLMTDPEAILLLPKILEAI